MATILLVIILIMFIGLGIPDSLFGTAWPAIYKELNVGISSASCVTLIISAGTVISSILSASAVKRFGTAVVTAVSTAMTAVALLGFSLSPNLLFLCIMAIPLGLGAGCIDTALNNYIALHYKATHMSFLHCFYGVGVSVSPYIMSIALSEQGWRFGYRSAFLLQFIISIISIVSIPLWKKAFQESGSSEDEISAKTLTIGQMIKNPGIRAIWLIFITSCAIEYVCGAWGSTFLVNSKGFTVPKAAEVITFYYAGMAVGRFFSGILANKISSWKLVYMGQAIIFTMIVAFFFSLPSFAFTILFFIMGVGVGPVFPNLTHLTPQNFGKEISQAVMGTQMAASYIGIMLLPPLFGILAQQISTDIFPYFLLILFAVMMYSVLRMVTYLKKEKKYIL